MILSLFEAEKNEKMTFWQKMKNMTEYSKMKNKLKNDVTWQPAQTMFSKNTDQLQAKI